MTIVIGCRLVFLKACTHLVFMSSQRDDVSRYTLQPNLYANHVFNSFLNLSYTPFRVDQFFHRLEILFEFCSFSVW